MNRKRITFDIPWPFDASMLALSRVAHSRTLIRTHAVYILVIIGLLLWGPTLASISPIASAGTLTPIQAGSTPSGLLSYQCHLADANGNPLSDSYEMIFRLYPVASGGTHVWEEQWTGTSKVAVRDGLCNVMLGSRTAFPPTLFRANDELWLGVTVGGDPEMTPRIRLGNGLPPIEKPTPNIVQDEQATESSITGTTQYQDKCTVTITTKGGKVLILSSFNHVALPAGNGMQIRLLVGSKEKLVGDQYNSGWVNGAMPWVVDLPPGTHTIKLQYRVIDPAGTAYISHATLIAAEQ